MKSENAPERREGHFKSSSHAASPEVELFYQTWSRPDSVATLVVTHGISEHSEAYAKTAASLCALGWDVIAWDLRGHGRSEGKRGHIADFNDYSRDLSALLNHIKKHGQLEKPFAVIGHSMGGLVTLRFLIAENENAPKPSAATLSSPLLGVALEVPAAKDFAARMLRKVWPSITLYNEIKSEDLTRDSEWLQGYEKDPLRHDKISPELYLGMFETMSEVKSKAQQIQLPILVQAAGQERIVSLPEIKAFFPKMGSVNKKLIVYEESYHEIFNDLDRELVFRDLDLFLRQALGLRKTT